MAVQNYVELLRELERGGFDAVLGTTECEDIEFKQAPYRLKERSEKWELAKDVAALANQRGGVIVVGFKTERRQNQLVDTATAHHAIMKNLIDWDCYRQTVVEWIRPTVEGLDGRWFQDNLELDRGVFALIIPSQPNHAKYFVVSHMVMENAAFSGAVGVPIRRGDAVEWLRPDTIHALLREALWLREKGPAMTVNISQAIKERISERVAGIETAAGWEETPFIALHAIPDLPQPRPNDFYSDNGLKGRLASPNVLRPNGFNISTTAEPEAQPDGSLLCQTSRRLLWLAPDGCFTAGATADEEFLGWYINQRRTANTPIVVNPQVTAEYFLEFCRFVHSELKPRYQTTWSLCLSIAGFDRKSGVTLAPGINSDSTLSCILSRHSCNTFIPIRPRADKQLASLATSGADAHLLMVEFYALFAAPPNKIPYVVKQQISEKAILARAGQQ